MTLLELREYIESQIPAWILLIPIGLAGIIVIVQIINALRRR